MRLLLATSTVVACVYHLHIPKCAGTFVWRFFKERFCHDEAKICGRDTLALPPACECVVNPITQDKALVGAVKRGEYKLVSAHSLISFGNKCALVAWFREPAARVYSHWGYFRYRRGLNGTLSELLTKKASWATNQQWSLVLRSTRRGTASPTDAEGVGARVALSGLAFVGIVEDMDASLCMFANRYLDEHDLCSGNAKPNKENSAAAAGRRSAVSDDPELQALIEKYNKYDTKLYSLAKLEFQKRLADDPKAAALARLPPSRDRRLSALVDFLAGLVATPSESAHFR